MEFNTKKFLNITVGVSLGLNIILSALLIALLKDFFTEPVRLPQQVTVNQATKGDEPEVKTFTRIEKEYVLVPSELRKNDTSNDGWIEHKWNEAYTNPERTLLDRAGTNHEFSDAEETTECPAFNYDDANSYSVFENEELLLRVPFNEKWGTGSSKLTPYAITDNEVRFGWIYQLGEGWDGDCKRVSWTSSARLSIEEKKSLTEFLSDAGPSISGVKMLNIPSAKDPSQIFTVLEFVDGGISYSSVLVFSGEKHLYILSADSPSRDKIDFDILEDIVSTIELKK